MKIKFECPTGRPNDARLWLDGKEITNRVFEFRLSTEDVLPKVWIGMIADDVDLTAGDAEIITHQDPATPSSGHPPA